MERIYQKYEDPYVIAIDASLGTKEHIGYVTLRQGPLKPGQGIAKNLPEIGDISITGIVNLSGRPGAFLLQNTRLCTVMKLVDCITLIDRNTLRNRVNLFRLHDIDNIV